MPALPLKQNDTVQRPLTHRTHHGERKTTVRIEKRVLSENDEQALRLRERFRTDGVLVLNVNTAPFAGRLIPNAQADASADGKDHPTAGQRFLVPMKGTPYTVELGALVSPLGIPCSAPPWGKLMAVDLIGGDILWETALGSVHEMGPFPVPFHIEWGTPNLGGGIATAGGLFFIASTMDRQFRAFDTANGETLWRFTLPVDATATPMTYTYKDRQYVVINAGGHFMFNREPGDYLFAFALPDK